MKKYITIITLLIFNISCIAQNEYQFDYANFETQFLSYNPTKNSTISQKEYDYAILIIEDTKNAMKNNPRNFNLADYFNVLSAFLNLKESEQNIHIAYAKFKDAEGSCEYILSFEKSIMNNPKYDIIREKYNRDLALCKAKPATAEVFNMEDYRETSNLDLSLVKRIHQINIDDQKYRNETSGLSKPKQQLLDNQNQLIIDSLFEVHKSYVGRTLVGEKFEGVMWAVIQHAYPKLDFMEKYLPVIHKAVTDKELDVVPLKMLIDRYYGLKYGYQVFGSQSGFGFELADEETRKKIAEKYQIE